MSKPGRRPNREPSIQRTVYIPLKLDAELNLLITDPVREKPKYDARNQFLVTAIQERLARLKRKESGPPPGPTDIQRLINEIEFHTSYMPHDQRQAIGEILDRYRPLAGRK